MPCAGWWRPAAPSSRALPERIAGVVAAMLVAGTALAGEPEWFADVGPQGAAAKWGIPESNVVGFTVECVKDGPITIRPALFATSEPAPMHDIGFVVDGEVFRRNAALKFSPDDGAWQAEAEVARDDHLIAALRRGNEVTYDFEPPLREGDRFTLSLKGSAAAIDQALEQC